MAGWTRLRRPKLCGFCPHTLIPAEAPIYELRTGHSYRCEPCAERYFRTSPPADLAPVAPLPVYTPPPSAFVSVGVVARAAVLPFDARMRQVGEREPGEDG